MQKFDTFLKSTTTPTKRDESITQLQILIKNNYLWTDQNIEYLVMPQCLPRWTKIKQTLVHWQQNSVIWFCHTQNPH